MQGRLLPPLDGRVQSFPREGWEREFALAAELGFDAIELTIEMASWDIHPVLSEAGQKSLLQLSEETGVTLAGLCCDCFMEHPLVAEDETTRGHAIALLHSLIREGAACGLPMIELPMLGPNALSRSPSAPEIFARTLEPALALAEKERIDLLLETDLNGGPFSAFLDCAGHPRLGVNYDTGNSTWFGFDAASEIAAYATRIRNVHIKDCTRADYSVPLGSGETRFDVVFASLAQAGYTGGFVLQAARQADDWVAARDYLLFARNLVNEYLS